LRMVSIMPVWARAADNVVLAFLRVLLWNILPNGRSTAFYSIGSWRKKHADWFYEDLTALFDLLIQGSVKPVIAKRMPLLEAVHAHELIELGTVQGKIVLLISERT
jgi:NADPH:quinone reductase-like Zn-dependent oxidoreductase